jgi:hypothetical protein
MRAASRALTVLFAVTALGSPAGARAVGPQCPATVGDLPLSVATPFSGTPRPVADGDGEITSTSLLCAYGEGVAPSAEVLVSWETGAACGTTEVDVAPSLDQEPFDALAAELAAAVGGACPPVESSTFPVVPVVAGGAAALVVGIVLLRRRRRRPEPDMASVPAAVPPEPPSEREPVPAPEPEPVAEPGPDPEPEPDVRRDLRPVLAELSTRHGRALVRSEAGQWLTVAAVARAVDRAEVAELAHAGSRSGQRPAQDDLAALASALAHQATGRDR